MEGFRGMFRGVGYWVDALLDRRRALEAGLGGGCTEDEGAVHAGGTRGRAVVHRGSVTLLHNYLLL